jgi:uncharacterized protein YuzE
VKGFFHEKKLIPYTQSKNRYLINRSFIITMNFSFDKIANALYIRISSEKVLNSDEIAEGIIIDYGKNENILGVEVLNFTDKNLNLNDLVQMTIEELIPRLAQC